jgi:hypothetical protein
VVSRFRFGVSAFSAPDGPRWERHGLSYVTVFEDAMEAFAPALAALVGR